MNAGDVCLQENDTKTISQSLHAISHAYDPPEGTEQPEEEERVSEGGTRWAENKKNMSGSLSAGFTSADLLSPRYKLAWGRPCMCLFIHLRT